VAADPDRFGAVVKARRKSLGLNRAAVAALGGPGTMTQYNIENVVGKDPRAATFDAYDQALCWKPGSAARAYWEGHEPVPDVEMEDVQRAQRAAADAPASGNADDADTGGISSDAAELSRLLAEKPSIRIAARRLADLSEDDLATYLDLIEIVERRRIASEGE
jgi:hypothetical protein